MIVIIVIVIIIIIILIITITQQRKKMGQKVQIGEKYLGAACISVGGVVINIH